jgi:GNAT superfamily N-acetyltransferase
MALDFLTDKKEEQGKGPVFSPSTSLPFLSDQKPGLVDVYNGVMDADPVKTAKVISFARKLDEPEVFVEKNLPEIEKSANSPTMQYWAQFEQENPITASYLSNPANMAAAKDVVDELGFFEKLINSAKTGFQSGEMNVEYSRLGWQQLMGTLRTGQRSLEGEQRLKELETQMQEVNRPEGFAPFYYASEQLPNMLLMAEQGLKRGLQTAGGFSLGALALGQAGPQALAPEEVVTVPGAAATGLTVGGRIGVAEAGAILEGGAAFREFINIKDKNGNPINPLLAAEAALAVGLINAGLEYASMNLLLKTIPGGSKVLDFMGKEEIKKLAKKQTGKTVLIQGVKRYLQSIAGEVGTEIAQEAVTAGGGQLLQGEVDLGEIAGQSMQVINPTIQSTMLFGLPGLGAHTIQGMQNVQQAQVDAEVYKAIGEAAANSQYLERLPEGWRELVEANTKDGKLENIYIDTENLMTFFQEANQDIPAEQSLQMVAEELGIGEQLQEAIDTNKPLRIPYAVWLEKVVKTPLYKQMEQHIKFSEEGLTLFQAQEEEKRVGEMIAEEQKRAEKYIKSNESLQIGYDTVYNDIKEKLIAAGRPKVEAEAGARLWASRAVAESVRRNINPVEWYMGQNRPEVRTGTMPTEGTAQLNQSQFNSVRDIENKWRESGLKLDLEESQNKIILSRIVVPKNQRNQGIGTNALNELVNYSDSVGKTLSLTPSDDFGGNKTKLKEFYKRFGFVENKGKNKNYEISESMYREPQSAAQSYNQVNTDSEAFKKWFGDSKVVDENGKPLVVYHGTANEFEVFDENKIGENYFESEGGGFFFTQKKRSAENYASLHSRGKSDGYVMPVYLSIKNPLVREVNSDYLSPADFYDMHPDELIRDAKIDGRDGIIIKGTNEDSLFVAFFPEQIKSIYNQGTFDPSDPNIFMQDINAQVTINKEQSVITLFKTANASSFLHESAHLFLNDTFEFVKSGQADEEYMGYWSKIAKHLDVKEGQETLTTEQQEKFAREFEAYLREGKAPSEGLRKAFSAFRRWLTRIYRDITGLGVEVTDEVREIMDRMLATEEEIREREIYNGYDKDLIKESDVSPATWKKLQDLKEKAHEMAIEQLLKPQMEELKPEYNEWLQQERERVRKIVSDEVAKLPIYQVMEAVRMSFGQVKNVKDIAQRYINNAEGITNEGIAKLEAIADAYGYSSGDHLAKEIINAPLFADEVNSRLEVHMAQYMDLKDTMNIKYEAEIAVRNDGRLDLMSLERAILLDLIEKEELSQAARQRALERARIHTAAAKRYAKAILADKPYREAQAATSYFAAERNAAVKEAGYYNAKDYEKAAKYAEQRILNHALAVEALRVRSEVEKAFKYLDKWQKQKRPDKIGQEHLNQIDKILNRFGLRELTQNAIEDTTTLNDWINAHTAEDYDEAAIPPDIANEAFAKNYKNLTLGELRDLVSAIKNIETVARNENRLLTDDQKREFQAVVDSLVASIKSKNKVNFPKSYDPNQTAIDKAAHYLRGFVAAHKKVEYIVRALDGYKDQGPLWDLIIKPMMRGMDKEYKLRAEMGSKLEKIYRKHYGKETHKLAETKVHVPEVANLFPKGLTKENILAMALNWGTESNRIRLIDAYNETIELTGEEVKEIIQMYRSRLKPSEQGDVSNYDIILQYKRDQIKAGIQAAFDQVMTENDWRFVQSVWDFIGSYWPQIAADKKVRTGVEPVKLPAATVETRFGTLEGGYYPVSYDPRMSEKASRQQEESSLKELFNLSFMKPSTRRSFEKERVEKVFNRPLDLHLSVIDKHLSDVAHSVAFTNAIRDADKLLNNQQVQRAIKEAVGDETYKQFRPWLQGIAREGRDTATVGPWAAVEKILSRARIGSSIVNMGLKMTTAFSQVAGIIPVMDKIGARRTAAGVMDFYKKMITGKAKEDIDFVFSKSEMMKNRMQNRDRDIKDATRKLLAKNQFDEIKDSYFSLTGLFDLAICMPTWIASYNKSIEEQVKSGKGEVNEETAIRYADLVVRETQGSGDIVNMAAVQRGTEIQKLLTQFYSYFSVYANRQIEAFDRAKRNGEYSQLVSFALYWWFFPAVVSELLAGRGPDDDDDDRAGWWASTLLRYPASAFIVARDFANAIGSGFGFELSPSAEAFAKTVQFLNLLPKTISGDAEPGKLLKTGFEAGGYWLQYPSKQISTTVGNIYEAMVEGEDFYLRDLFFPKPRSRR